MIFSKKKLLQILLVQTLFFLTIYACQKAEDVPIDNGTVKIVSLTTNDSVLKAYVDTALVAVVATGDNLNFEWTCNHGTLRGSGDTVKYAAGQCCIGLNTITCRVYNDSTSVSQDINITIASYYDNK